MNKFKIIVDSDACPFKNEIIVVMSCELEEFDKCSRTIFNWQKYILNSFTCTYTNGYTEGVNNKIKVLKRNAYGVRSFWRFKNRIMHVMN